MSVVKLNSTVATSSHWLRNVMNASFNATSSAPSSRSLTETLLIGFVLVLIILITVLGNLLVCVTIATNRRLKTPTNFFVLSLSSTDLLLGCIVLPFSAINTVYEPWLFGAVFCNIYTSCDVMLCTVSILTLFAISLDRYYAVQRPLDYLRTMSIRLVVRVNVAIWSFSLLMAFVPIHAGWNSPDGSVQNYDNPSTCSFQLNVPYVLLVAVGTYFVPLILMCTVYIQVLRVTRRQVREINRLTRIGVSTPIKNKTKSLTSSEAKNTILPSPNNVPPSPLIITNNAVTAPLMAETNGCSRVDQMTPKSNRHNNSSMPHSQSNGISSHKYRSPWRWTKSQSSEKTKSPSSDRCDGCSPEMHGQQKFLSDTKATATLASVVVCFAVCWVPYFTLFTAKPFLARPVNLHLDLFVLWLGYVNSVINPFLYAFYNSNFRDGFYRILCRHRYEREQAARNRLDFMNDSRSPRNHSHEQQALEMPMLRSQEA